MLLSCISFSSNCLEFYFINLSTGIFKLSFDIRIMAALSEATQLKIALDKAIDMESSESVMDILSALSKVPMTEDILRSTKVGVVVNKFAKATPTAFSSESTALAKEVIGKWKSAVKPPSVSVSAGPNSVEKKSSVNSGPTNSSIAKPTGAAPAARAPAAPVIVLTSDQSAQIRGYPEGRKHTVKLLQENIYIHVAETENQDDDAGNDAGSSSSDSGNASVLASIFGVAMAVESEVNSLLPYATNSKGYISKTKALTVNLKRNEGLAMEVLSGSLTPAALCKLSIDQLATQQEQAAQQEILQRKFDAGRTDYYDVVMRDKVMKANGLDPNAAGEFTCRKCKGTKTSHYSMQTRSSDEPMTVFVKCLGCGTRWRC